MKIFLNTFSRNYEEGYHQGVFPETEVKKEIDFGEVDRGKGLEKEIEEGFGGVKWEVEGKEEGKEERWNWVHPPLHPKSLSKKQKKMLPSKKRLAKAIDKINREFPFAGTRPKKRKNKSDLLSSHSQPKKKKSLKMIKQKLNKMIDQTLTSSKKLRNKKDQNEYPDIKTEQPCCPDYTPTIKTEQEGIEEKLATGEVKGIEKLKNKGKDRNGIVEFVNNKGEIEYLCVSVQVLKKVWPQVLCEFYERVFRKVRRCYGVEV